ncbi:SCO3374 family protein [Streptomyces sp. AK02-01A]|uniref:SCO3374 family protein n=1 Tax=Streptomyces sp. AK02-01A TaxID=3028648 RepID=UPI0029BE7780|nr:SCO3374 family protein [Streptomyces sp. AK02-01A]MDX3850895.1 SCO3374 family protein [Streptomyces sp. AK02-01A]
MVFTVPPPRAPLDDGCAQWYENELGWATVPGPPVQLVTGLRFDVLELPADAGAAVLRRIGPTGPVARCGRRMRLLVAAGSADELPGLLDWLEWGGITLGLTAAGVDGRMTAPAPPGLPRTSAQGAAVWLRPPKPGREVEPTLPALTPFGRGIGTGGSGGDTPDLVRLVDAAATECHRVRLLRGNTLRTNAQPLAFS